MIVKVQRSACGKQLLIYSNKDERLCIQLPYEAVKGLEIEPLGKQYWRASFRGRRLQLLEQVKESSWES